MTDRREYTAVIYFHGMGSQRRYEEPSRLIDALDTYLSHANDDTLGIIREIKPKIEAMRGSKTETVDYIDTCHKIPSPNKDKPYDEKDIRFYEAYWAPIMARTRSPRDVACWALRQAIRPVLTWRTPWRERQRLRRSALSDLYDKPRKWPKGILAEDFTRILTCYSDYNNLSVKRGQVSPDLEGFKTFIGSTLVDQENRDALTERLNSLADAWARHYRTTEIRNAVFIANVLLALVLAFGGAAWVLFYVISFVVSEIPNLNVPTWLTSVTDGWKDTTFWGALAMIPGFVLTLGAGRFLSNSLGDVQAWSTLDETDPAHEKREKVLTSSCKLIAHVLEDPKCTRALVVSHSLGTSVAHDTLLRMGWKNSADGNSAPIKGPPDLRKIRHFITMGSPVDKIQYFFESTRSDSHRYMRVKDKVRGDLTSAPFANNQHPHIHWVNYWDEADIISGALHSDTGEETVENGVDNVHVQNRHFPNPAKAHMDYIGNQTVIRGIFEMAYLNKHNYDTLKDTRKEGQKGLDYASMQLKPGEPLGRYRIWQALALFLPLLLTGGLLAKLLGLSPYADWVLVISAAIAVLLATGWFIDRTKGNKSPI